MNNISQEDIKRFLNGDCNPEEAERVHLYLLRDVPEHLLWEEWLSADKKEALPASLTQQMDQYIHSKIQTSRKHSPLLFVRVAAACLVLLLLSLPWINQGPYPPATRGKPQAQHNPWLLLENSTDQITTAVLPDGSKVSLHPGSHLRYQNDNPKERSLFLEGRAVFYVAKNKEKKFIVHSRQLSTTAIGTVFEVDQTKDKIAISLFEGKVLVAALADGQNTKTQQAYLEPGTRLVYHVNGNPAFKIHSLKNEPVSIKEKKKDKNENKPVLHFDHTPLDQVLQALEHRYQTSIAYNEQEITGLYFTGQVLPHDSLKTILTAISHIKKLQVSTINDGYQIKK